MASIAAFTGGGRAGSLAYAAAKAGLFGITYSLAHELSLQGINANAIAPGLIANTGFTGEGSEELGRSVVSEMLVGRDSHVNDIAAAASFLASKEASFISGEVFM